jgi:hypothetical protein
MQWRRSVAEQGLEVLGGAVALVHFETVLRIAGGEIAHECVAGDLRHDRGRSDTCTEVISPHHSRGGKRQTRIVAVHEDVVDADVERTNSPLHTEADRLPDADGVDLGGFDVDDGTGECLSANECGDGLAPRRREPLGVVESLDTAGWGEHHGREGEWTRQRSPADLVDSCYETCTGTMQAVLVAHEALEPG